jgi:ABC-type transport system involved in cytochrome bd biosynthesis fused ATPase/permease subunit
MENNDVTKRSNPELLAEKQKIKKSKLFHALSIGFLAGIVLFGVGAWLISEKRSFALLFPLMIPIVMIRSIIKKPNPHAALEAELKARGLH